MGRRPRTLLVGLVVALAALGSQQTVGSQPASSRVLEGSVSAGGSAAPSPDWRVVRRSAGTYRIVVPGSDIEIDVPDWDQAADVTIVPMGRGEVEVRFTQGRERVDSDFAFVALVRD